MSERFKVHAWKACVPKRYRGFESPSFRLSSGAMQVSAAKPRQSRKAATVCGRKSCRRLPELFYLSSMSDLIRKIKTILHTALLPCSKIM